MLGASHYLHMASGPGGGCHPGPKIVTTVWNDDQVVGFTGVPVCIQYALGTWCQQRRWTKCVRREWQTLEYLTKVAPKEMVTTSGMEAPVHPDRVQRYTAKSIPGSFNSKRGG